MARVDTLAHFLSDVADAIRGKKGTSAEIPAENFDTEITGIVIPELEATKAATPSTSAQTITPSQGYDGMEEVTISAVDSTIDANIVATNIKSGVSILGVSGSVVELAGETVSITPSTSQQVITPGTGKNGITQATVAAVDSTIDANIVQANIRSGVTILGVQGNLEPDKPDQTKTCTPSTSQQVIEPDVGYELASVTVSAVTASIDANITAANIADGVEILGVTGTYDGGVAEALADSY